MSKGSTECRRQHHRLIQNLKISYPSSPPLTHMPTKAHLSTLFAPTQCAYLFLSPHCKLSPPTTKCKASQLTNERPIWKHGTSCDWLITGSGLTTDYTPHTLFKDSFQGCFSHCFQLFPFWGHLSAIWTNTVYVLATLQLCQAVHDYLKI